MYLYRKYKNGRNYATVKEGYGQFFSFLLFKLCDDILVFRFLILIRETKGVNALLRQKLRGPSSHQLGVCCSRVASLL